MSPNGLIPPRGRVKTFLNPRKTRSLKPRVCANGSPNFTKAPFGEGFSFSLFQELLLIAASLRSGGLKIAVPSWEFVGLNFHFLHHFSFFSQAFKTVFPTLILGVNLHLGVPHNSFRVRGPHQIFFFSPPGGLKHTFNKGFPLNILCRQKHVCAFNFIRTVLLYIFNGAPR